MNSVKDWLVLVGLVLAGGCLLGYVWHGQYTGKWQ